MIDLLVDRLRWPAALVRERAAAQIALLIAEGRQDVSDALLAWIGRQELESRAGAGILPFLRAKELTNVQPVDTQELAETCRARSVLSDLFMSHYDPSYGDATTSARHLGLPPAGWHPPDENRETTARGLEQDLVRMLRSTDNHFHSSLTRQFEFECAKLRELHGDSPTRASRLAGTRQEGFHPAWYTRSDEIAASAYLRTLASVESIHGIPGKQIPHLAALLSPVDMGLWQVKSAAKPEWWPNLETEPVPTSIDAQIAAAIQKTNDAANAWAQARTWSLQRADAFFSPACRNTIWRFDPFSSKPTDHYSPALKRYWTSFGGAALGSISRHLLCGLKDRSPLTTGSHRLVTG